MRHPVYTFDPEIHSIFEIPNPGIQTTKNLLGTNFTDTLNRPYVEARSLNRLWGLHNINTFSSWKKKEDFDTQLMRGYKKCDSNDIF